jgi:hypothetical protein
MFFKLFKLCFVFSNKLTMFVKTIITSYFHFNSWILLNYLFSLAGLIWKILDKLFKTLTWKSSFNWIFFVLIRIYFKITFHRNISLLSSKINLANFIWSRLLFIYASWQINFCYSNLECILFAEGSKLSYKDLNFFRLILFMCSYNWSLIFSIKHLNFVIFANI